LSSRTGAVTITHALERVDGARDSRTLGLLGFGVTRPLGGPWSFEAAGVGGFDVVDDPRAAWMAAVGARAGLQWSSGKRTFDSVQVSVTGVVDVSRNESSDRTVFATVSTGFRLPAR
jgi:hypothetical protein